MEKRHGFYFVSLLLASMSLVLVGCGGGETSNTTDDPSTSQETTQEDQQPETDENQTETSTEDTSSSDETSETSEATPDSTEVSADDTEETTSDTSTDAADESALEIGNVVTYPTNAYITTGGSIALSATISNPTSAPITETIWLKVNSQNVGSQEIHLAANSQDKLYFQVDGIDRPGRQIIGIQDWARTFEVVDPALDPAVRPGEVSVDAKVISENEGIVDVGIPGGQIITTAFEPPKTFNPYAAQETSSTSIIHRMHAYLLEENPMNYELQPALAKSWEISEDGTEITFYLRKGLKFSDGHPFTADDVVFTVNDVILNCDIPNNYSDTYFVNGSPIQYEKIDDYTVKAHLPAIYRPYFNEIKNDPILPKHVLEKRVSQLVSGAWQNFSVGQCAYLDNRGAMRAAYGDFLLQNGTAEDQITEQTDAKFDLVGNSFDGLRESLSGQDVADIKGKALEATMQLQDLKAEIGGADLQAIIDGIISDLGGIEARAQAGEWGVPTGTFTSTWGTADAPSSFVGLGPYTLTRYDVEQQVVLDRNPNYWKVDTNGVQLPYIENVTVLILKDRNTQVAKFRNGETDILQLDASNRPQDWPLILEDADARGWEAITGGPIFGTLWAMFNQDAEKRGDPGNLDRKMIQAVFRELDFRKAVAHSVDRQSLIANIYNGLGKPQWSPISVPSPFFDNSLGDDYEPYPFDLDIARDLLEGQALSDLDGDGVRNITDEFLRNHGFTEEEIAQLPAEIDRKLTFTISTNSGNEVRESSSEALASDLKRVGVEVNYKPKDFNALVNDLLGSTYDVIVLGFTGDVDPHQPNVWSSTGHLHSWHYTAVDDPYDWEVRIDELIAAGVATYDFEEAKAIYDEFQQIARDNLPMVYLVNQRNLYVSKKGLANNRNFKANAPFGFNAGRGFDDVLWWRDEARRTASTN
jgi:ABC-type transport system substrate-binding protein